MTNKEKYAKVFKETFFIGDEVLSGLKYQDIAAWDSVGQMNLVARLEDVFGIAIRTDDIIDLSSYEKGMEILEKYGVHF